MRGVLAQGLEHDRLKVAVQSRVELARGDRLGVEYRLPSGEGSLKRQQLVEGRTQAPDVGTGIVLLGVPVLLGGHVRQGA